jgi:ATP-dependent RNA helicase DeaD
MFINLGTADGFDKGRMLGYLCGITGLTNQHIGRILMKDMYSFIDIDAAHFQEVLGHFGNANYKGRKIRVDEGNGGGAGAPRPSGPRHGAHDGPPKKKFQKARY